MVHRVARANADAMTIPASHKQEFKKEKKKRFLIIFIFKIFSLWFNFKTIIDLHILKRKKKKKKELEVVYCIYQKIIGLDILKQRNPKIENESAADGPCGTWKGTETSLAKWSCSLLVLENVSRKFGSILFVSNMLHMQSWKQNCQTGCS